MRVVASGEWSTHVGDIDIVKEFRFTLRASASYTRQGELTEESSSDFDVSFSKSPLMTLSIEVPSFYMLYVAGMQVSG